MTIRTALSTSDTTAHKPVKSPDSLQPVFIVGTPKSGTTFLLSLFDSHPNVIALLETAAYHVPLRGVLTHRHALARLDNFYAGLMGQHTIHAAVTRKAFLEKARESKLHDKESVSKSLIKMFVSIVLESLPPQVSQNVTHFIEKNPRHYDAIDRIFRDFPQAKVIHVLRDPRDNYLALKRMMSEAEYQGLGYHPTNFLRDRLLGSLEAAYENVEKYRGRYRVLFYEDLIVGGEPLIRNLIEWLRLPWHEVLLVPSYSGELWGGNSLAQDLRDKLKPFDRRPIGRWKKELSKHEVEMLEWVIDAYHLAVKYPTISRLNEWQRLYRLALPFPEELRWRGMASPRNWIRRMVQAIAWNYISRRFWIGVKLWNRIQRKDSRLTVSGT